jgi:hypothetical protein
MRNVPTLVLYSVPRSLSPEWQRVFKSLVEPLYQVRCLLHDPRLLQQSVTVLKRNLPGVDRAKEDLKRTVAGLAAVAPKTFDAGWAIRNAVEPIAAQLGGFLLVKVPASPSLSLFLEGLREQRNTFPERELLEALLEAVTAEKAIDLSAEVPAPPRVRCNESDRSVELDGRRIASEVELPVFRFFKAIADAYPDPIPFKKIRTVAPRLRGKHPTRDLNDRLPTALARLVRSGKHGYSLELPASK